MDPSAFMASEPQRADSFMEKGRVRSPLMESSNLASPEKSISMARSPSSASVCLDWRSLRMVKLLSISAMAEALSMTTAVWAPSSQ